MFRRCLIAMSFLFVVGIAARAEATPFLLRFDYSLFYSGAPQGAALVANFVYDDSAPLAPGSTVTDILFASVYLDDHKVFSQWQPGGFFLFDLLDSVYGPNFFVPTQFLPTGLTTLAFSELRIAFDEGNGLQVQQCDFGGTQPCNVTLTQLQSIPEPSSMLFGLGAIAAAVAVRRRSRAREGRIAR